MAQPFNSNSREIKFRGHQTASDTWFYGSYVNYLPKQEPWDNTPACRVCDIVDENGSKHFVNPFTVGQYTGLHDKNGKEIYEGDIILTYGSKGDEIKHAVYYSDKEAMFRTKLIGADMLGGNITQRWLNEFDFEVIGNIHDNPELLKE